MCRLCAVDIESQDHIVNCVFVRGANQIIPIEPYLSDNVPLDKINFIVAFSTNRQTDGQGTDVYVIIDTDKPCYEKPTQSKPTRVRNVMK